MHFIKAEGGSKLNDGRFKRKLLKGLEIRQVTHEQAHARVPKSTQQHAHFYRRRESGQLSHGGKIHYHRGRVTKNTKWRSSGCRGKPLERARVHVSVWKIMPGSIKLSEWRRRQQRCEASYLDISLFVQQGLSCCNEKENHVRAGEQQKGRVKATSYTVSERWFSN